MAFAGMRWPSPCGTVVGLICGGGVAVGLFFAGKSMWPAEIVEGTCKVTNPASVTYECTRGKGKILKLNMANVTFEDGSVRQCNTFWTTDNCGIFGSDEPTAVLQGAARQCYWLESGMGMPGVGSAPAGACVEPGHVGGNKVGSITLWICGALLFPCCLCFGVGSDVKGGPSAMLTYLEDSSLPAPPKDKYDIAHAKRNKEDAGAHPRGGEAATATDADCV